MENVMDVIVEKTAFLADNLQTAVEQNKALSHHLIGEWKDHNAVCIKRIVIGSTMGWKLIYRE